MKPNEIANKIFDPRNYKTALNDVQFKIEETDDTVYVYFQGTSSKFDVLLDIMFLPKSFCGLKVHGGIAKGLSSSFLIIMNYINFSKRICVCGHSMGGAYAVLFGYVLYILKDIAADVITFGMPKIFLKKSQMKALEEKVNIVSFENRMDIVPKIPHIYHKPKSIMIGNKFSIKQFFKFEENHMCYGNEELYNEL